MVYFKGTLRSSTKQSPWEDDIPSTDQEISRLLRNPKFHFHVQKSSPLDRTQTPRPHFFEVHLKKIHLHLGLRSNIFPSGFSTKILDEFVISLMRAVGTHVSYLIYLF